MNGEAYFEVTKNSRQPFMVRTPQKAVVKVYGTQFNVEAYADDKTITATLVEGSIAMAYENKKSNWTEQEIQPGQEIVYTAAQQQIKIDQADLSLLGKTENLFFVILHLRKFLKCYLNVLMWIS